jgi:hypothetical protein
MTDQERLTPQEMWKIVETERGFRSSPGSASDNYRKSPATLPSGVQAGDPGQAIGKGYETFAVIQVLDAKGNVVDVATGFFEHGGLEKHAERQGLRGLASLDPAQTQGGKMMVVVDQNVCGPCEKALVEFARGKGIQVIDVHLPERANYNYPHVFASPKTAGRNVYRNPNRPTNFRVVKTRTIIVVGRIVPMESAVSASMARLGSGLKLGLAVTGAASTTLGVVATATNDFRYKEAADILAPKMLVKWAMLQSLKNLPKPKIDKQAAEDYFSDPATASGMRTIDLLSKHLRPYALELQQHHARVRAGTILEIMSAARLPEGRRTELLDSLGNELNLYELELNTLLDNLEAAQELKPQALDAAKSAEQLAKLAETVLVKDWLLKQGFDWDEIEQMILNLSTFAAVVTRAFNDLDVLQAQAQRMLIEVEDDVATVNKVYWTAILEPIVEALRPAPAVGGLGQDVERVLAALPSGNNVPRGRLGLSADEIYQKVRKDGKGFIPNIATVKSALAELERQGFASSGVGVQLKGGAEYWRSGSGDQYLRTHSH